MPNGENVTASERLLEIYGFQPGQLPAEVSELGGLATVERKTGLTVGQYLTTVKNLLMRALRTGSITEEQYQDYMEALTFYLQRLAEIHPEISDAEADLEAMTTAEEEPLAPTLPFYEEVKGGTEAQAFWRWKQEQELKERQALLDEAARLQRRREEEARWKEEQETLASIARGQQETQALFGAGRGFGGYAGISPDLPVELEYQQAYAAAQRAQDEVDKWAKLLTQMQGRGLPKSFPERQTLETVAGHLRGSQRAYQRYWKDYLQATGGVERNAELFDPWEEWFETINANRVPFEGIREGL